MAWTKSSVNRNFLMLLSDETRMDGTTPVNSPTIEESIGGQPILVGIQIVDEGADVAADLDVDVSHNDSAYIQAVGNAIADTTPNVAGTYVGIADLFSINGPYFRLQFNDAAADVGDWTLATYDTVLVGADNDITWTAVDPVYAGVAGNDISITYTDPSAVDQSLAIIVDGTDIDISLATDGAGTITTTAAAIEAAILADADASALVTAVDSGADDGTGVVTAMAAKVLGTDGTPGVDGGTFKFIVVARIPDSITSYNAGG